MTARELHEQKIIPLESELRALRKQYEELWFVEQAQKNGIDKCCCNNCAYSCVLDVGDYSNYCINNRDTCSHDRCYAWTPETEISKYFRSFYHYDTSLLTGLANLFGKDFVTNQSPDKLVTAQKALELVKELKG